MRNGDKLHLEVRGVNLSGVGVGDAGVEGEVRVEVPGVFGGERALVSVDHVAKGGRRAFATAMELVRAHPARREAPCPNHVSRRGGRCTGCALMPLAEPAQREAKRELLRQEFGLEVEEVEAAPANLGYRMSAKRVAFGSPGRLHLGSFVRGTHRPAPMPGCLVDHPRIAAASDALEAAARELGVGAYDERSGRGDLRAVWLKTDGERVLACLVFRVDDEPLARALADAVPSLDGVSFSVQPDDGNALRGGEARTLRGIDALSVDVGNHVVEVGPLGFLQPNPVVAAAMYRALVSGPDGGALPAGDALDLYAGSGATTALLRPIMRSVAPCESYPESAAALGVEPQEVAAFLAARTASPDLCVANPPRRGLGPEVVRELRRLHPGRLHILACGPAGLARDLEALTAGGEGAFRLERLRAFDTLPQTPHVELLAQLSA